MNPPSSTNNHPSIEERLSATERALNLSNRLKDVEEQIGIYIQPKPKIPWWDGWWKAAIGLFASAIIPLATLIIENERSEREYTRLMIQQNDQIRQKYLDRVLRQGISETEQLRLFKLLAKLKADDELQDWAKAELQSTQTRVDQLQAKVDRVAGQRDTLMRKDSLNYIKIRELTQRLSGGDQRIRYNESQFKSQTQKIRQLERESAINNAKLAELNNQLGETKTQLNGDIQPFEETSHENILTKDYCVTTINWEDNLKPVSGVTISVHRHGTNEPPKFATTNQEGKACLSVIVGKSYSISAYKDGYYQYVYNTVPSSRETTNKTFRLQWIKK